jgi:hypothetical protein
MAAIAAASISHAHAAPPVADAGPDITIVDSNNDGVVTVRLNASASTDPDGDIISHTWSWPSGNASGVTPEVVFPVSPTPLALTLTVTDAAGNSSVDSLTATVLTKEEGLFTDFRKTSYSGTDFTVSPYGSRVVGTLRGDTLVIDPKGSGVPEIYRFSEGNWIPSPFSASVVDIRAIDANKLISGNTNTATGFTAHRFVAGNWVATPQSVPATPPGRRIQDNAYKAGAVASADSFDDTYFNNAGRAFVYELSGDVWEHTQLAPPEGFAPGKRWGEGIDTDGTTTAVTDGSGSTTIPNLKIFTKPGGWPHQASLAPPVAAGYGQSYFSGIVAVGNGTIVAQREFPHTLFVIEFDGSSWVQTPLPISPLIPFGGYFGLKMDDDGQSFVASDQAGRFILYQKDPQSSSWATATVTQRQLPITGMFGGNQLLCTDFTGGRIVLSDPVNGVVRIFDKSAPFDTINAEPVANAGADISTTSFDGQPVRLFLNGGLSSDANANETLTAVWTWPGGSASGLQTFAMIPPEVTTITLTITDSKGAISRDTLNTTIKRPPVINPGSNLAVADSDGDGLIRLHVNPTVISQDHPIVSWNWRWPGGTFSGRTGIITLGPDADGQPITLEAIDSNGLLSVTSFTFDLLNPDPVPDIIEPVDGVSLDRYGWAVGIEDGVALTGAPFKTSNGTYFAENINSEWLQYSMPSPDRRGNSVFIDGEFAFVGAPLQNQVIIYKLEAGQWMVSQTLSPQDAEGGAFGNSIARSGNTLIIGAPQTGVFNAYTGAVYVFEQSNGGWSQVQKIVSPDPPTFFGKEFGAKVAVSGNFLAVAQPGFATHSSVFVFEKVASSWNLTHQFQADIPRSPQGRGPDNDGDFFGVGLAMNDTELLIGSPQDDQIFRYTRSASNWTRNGEIAPGMYYRIGKSLALRDGVLAVGAYLDGTGRGFDADYVDGSIYIFSLNAGSWQQTGHLWPNKTFDPQLVDVPEFGYSVAHDGKDLIVGLPRARNSTGVQTGKVYIYRNYAPLNPNANYEPLANAGPDINVDDSLVRDPVTNGITEPLGSELISLSAAASSDFENSIVSHEWSWAGGNASGINASGRFPVGSTTVTLTVTDSANIVHSDTVVITVSLSQSAPAALPASAGNSLTLDLYSPVSKWRLSSEFLWHGDNEPAFGVVEGATYQVEILPYPGSTEVATSFVTTTGSSTIELMDLELPEPPSATGSISFPETSQGFSWRLVGESSWRDVADDGDVFAEDVEFLLPAGPLRIEFKPVPGFTTPQTRIVEVIENGLITLDWADYLRISSYDPARILEPADSPDLAASPYQYVGMIRSALGRGSGTVVADRVVLTAAHLFFDANGLQWADAQWFSRQHQGTRQAPPITPRGVLYQTSYAKLIAPDSVEGSVANLPEDPQQVDFAVLYFADESTWDQGSANFLQSTPGKNWLAGTENKHAVAYPQRSQLYENRGMMFHKQFASPLQSLGTGLYETTEVFGDGGASGSALFVQPAGSGNFYPAAILLAGQGRAVYRIIDEDITRMIKDGADAATGNDDVLNNDSSLLTFDGLGSLTTVGVQVFPAGIRTRARWTITPVKGASSANMVTTKQVAFNEKWRSYTISFSAISGYRTPPALTVLNGSVVRNSANIHPFTYTAIVRTTTPSRLETWKETNNITQLTDDGDGDGMNALIEYALDRNPGAADHLPPIRVSANPYQNVFPEYEIYVSHAADGIFYHVRASNSLDGSNAVTLATFTSDDGPSAYITVTDTQPFTSSPTRFAWVEIEVPTDP